MAISGRIAFTQVYGFACVAQGAMERRLRAVLAGLDPIERKREQAWALADTPTVDRLLFHNPQVAALNRRLWQESGLTNTGDMARALMRSSPDGPSPLFDRLKAVACPALVLVGLYDRNVGVDAVRDVAVRLSQAELVIFEHSAHFPDLEEPERYAAVVEDFLSTDNLT